MKLFVPFLTFKSFGSGSNKILKVRFRFDSTSKTWIRNIIILNNKCVWKKLASNGNTCHKKKKKLKRNVTFLFMWYAVSQTYLITYELIVFAMNYFSVFLHTKVLIRQWYVLIIIKSITAVFKMCMFPCCYEFQ